MEALVLGGIAVVFVLAIRAGMRASARREDTLGELARRLGGASESNRWCGACGDVPVELRFVTRGAGSTAESWTEIDADIPAAYPLLLHLRRHGWFDRGKIERGDLVDVQLGDPAFDDAFLVEGAPADVVRAWLDAEARGALLALGGIELDTRADGARRTLRLSIHRWLDDADAAAGAIEVAARLARRVRDAFAEVERAAEPVDAGSPYRPMRDDAPERAARQARHEEVAALQDLRADRARRATVTFWLVVVGMIVAAIAIAASV